MEKACVTTNGSFFTFKFLERPRPAPAPPPQDDLLDTTVQITKDFAASLHVDSNKRGPSVINALGTYSSGEFWVYFEATGER